MRRVDAEKFIDSGIRIFALAVFISVEALAAFFSKPMIGVQCFDDARLLDAAGETLAQNSSDLRRHIDAHFIEQGHGSHRHPKLDHRSIDRFDRVSLLEEKSRLVHIRPEDAVDDEAGTIVANDDGLSQLAGEVGDCNDCYI